MQFFWVGYIFFYIFEQYDYGGPLIKDNVQIGVMSWAELPCATGYPDFYTRLTYYIDWIKQALGTDEQHLQFVK